MGKINNWSILGICAGIIYIISSSIRYYIMYPDLDKVIQNILIGLCVIAISYLYNKSIKQDNILISLENYLADNKINNQQKQEESNIEKDNS